MKRQVALPLMVALLAAGCGSDSDNSSAVTPPQVEPTKPELSNVFGTPDAEVAKTGRVYLSIASKYLGYQEDFQATRFSCKKYGGPQDCNQERVAGNFDFSKMAMGQPPAPAGDNVYPASNVFDFEYLLDRVELDLKQEGHDQSIRSDVFNDGYASIVDVLMVAAEKYGLDVEYHFDEEMGTYWIDSINGIEGMDRAWLPDDEELLVPFAACSAPGGWKAVYGAPGADGQGGHKHSLEEIYQRLDEFYVQTDAAITLIPACLEEKEMRRDIYRAEQARIAANGGKVIIPEMIINFEWDRTAVFKNVEVKAHNQRSDIFKPGVLTQMDAILSLQEHSPAIEVSFNLWPRLSTGADVNGYLMNYLAMQGRDDLGNIFEYGHDSNAKIGWNYHAGEYERLNDQAFGMLTTFRGAFCNPELTGEEGMGGNDNQSIFFTLPGSPCTGGDWSPGSGSWVVPLPEDISPDGDPKKGPLHMGQVPYSWGDKTPYAPLGTFTDSRGFTKNRAYYPNGFGGNGLHVMSDVLVMHNPEYFEFYMNSFFTGSDSYMRSQVEKGASSQVSWQFESLPPELNFVAKDITAAVAPLTESHFGWGVPNCKTCHEDGANNGHVAKEMKPFECSECHGSNGAPVGHGEEATCGFCHAVSLQHHGNAYQEVAIPEGAWNPVSDPLAGSGREGKPAEYWGLHTDFPEPASCMSCHPSSNERFLKRK